jgi:hypothetical protein
VAEVPCACAQTEELLVKRRALLEKKIAQELDKAKEYTKAQNKRGKLSSLCLHARITACTAVEEVEG